MNSPQTTPVIAQAAAQLKTAIQERNLKQGEPAVFDVLIDRSNDAFDRLISLPPKTPADLALKVEMAHAHYPGFLDETNLTWLWQDIASLAV